MHDFIATFLYGLYELIEGRSLQRRGTLFTNLRIIDWLLRHFKSKFKGGDLVSVLRYVYVFKIETVAAALALVLQLKASRSESFLVFHAHPPLPLCYGFNNLQFADHYFKPSEIKLARIICRSLSTIDLIMRVPPNLYSRCNEVFTNMKIRYRHRSYRLVPANKLSWNKYDMFIVYNKNAAPLHDVFTSYFGNSDFTIALSSREPNIHCQVKLDPARLPYLVVVYYNGQSPATHHNPDNGATVVNLTGYYSN